MRKYCLMLTVTCLLTVVARADLLWDNYLSPDSYDHVAGLSSERNTFVTDSWTGDDALFVDPVTVQQISWIGMFEDHPQATYDTVDIVIHAANPDPLGPPIDSSVPAIAEFLDVPFSRTDITVEFGLQVYEGIADLPIDVDLMPGHYYYSVRAVGINTGRHYLATTGGHVDPSNPVIAGQTMGVFQSGFFNYAGHPDWVYVIDATMPARSSDYAYQLHGVVIPEPVSVGLLALGMLVLRRR